MLILDIETKPQKDLIDLFNAGITAPKNVKDPEKIKAAIEKKKAGSVKAMSVDTDYADIFCIGAYDTELNGGTAWIVELDRLSDLFKEHKEIVTFGGKRFDIPVIIRYGIKKGLDLPYSRLKDWTKRYSENHIDLETELGEYGKFRGLDEYLQIYLGIKKKEIDFSTCTDDELEEHCLEDVINTSKLYNLFKKTL